MTEPFCILQKNWETEVIHLLQIHVLMLLHDILLEIRSHCIISDLQEGDVYTYSPFGATTLHEETHHSSET